MTSMHIQANDSEKKTVDNTSTIKKPNSNDESTNKHNNDDEDS